MSRRSGGRIGARLARLEQRSVVCRACAAAATRLLRFVPDDVFEAMVGGTAEHHAETCPGCGRARGVPAKLYRESDRGLLDAAT